jgi:protein ImuB
MMKRVICVYFPAWPLQRLCRERPELRDKPVAFSNPDAPRGPQIVLCSRRAIRSGVRLDMPVAEAIAIERDLHIQNINPGKDIEVLGELAEWLTRYSPIVGLEEDPSPQSLLLDVSGCAACFQGEKKLLDRLVRELKTEGWTPRAALADTIGAAWGLAHVSSEPVLVPPGETEDALRQLPVAALQLPPETIEDLEELGIERIGQLTALDRSEIPHRFGELTLRRLDQASGRVSEVVIPHRPAPPAQAALPFDYPSDRPEHLHYAIDRLLERLIANLRPRHLGIRRMECVLEFETAPSVRIEIALCQPSASASYIGALLRTRLEQALITEPVCGMSLLVTTAEPITAIQSEFFETDRCRTSADLAALIDRLSSRLGPERVTCATLVPDPQPEYACRFDPVQHRLDGRQPGRSSRKTKAAIPQPITLPRDRPLRLWPAPFPIEVVSAVPEGPPARFWWAGVEHRIMRARGPERIEAGWWRGQDIRRDYYITLTSSGSRFWIFRRREDGRWFLHGCFD